jgi:hypothetical protein
LGGAVASVEDDGLVRVDEHAVLEVQPHRACEHDLLEIASLAREVLD